MIEIYLKESNKQILQEMQASGFNVTTCGMCGAVKLHRTGVDELTCENCDFTGDICDFPDMYTVQGTIIKAGIQNV